MTYKEFVKKYQGKTKGYPNDNSYKGECLSIVKLYIKECFGISPPPSGSNSAYGYWSNFPSPLGTIFEKVKNTSNGVPNNGDIIIWNTNVGNGHGHIDIFVEGNVNGFTGFDQNWQGRQAHLQNHNYKNVLGWLKPKTMNQSKELAACLETHASLMKQLEAKGKEVVRLLKKANDFETMLKKLSNSLKDLKAENGQLVKDKLHQQKKLTTASEQYALLDEKLKKVSTERTHYRTYYL